MTKYTDKDVEELVSEVEPLLRFIAGGSIVGTLNSRTFSLPNCERRLEEALKPFRPDPEEALIEAMAKAFNPAWPEDEAISRGMQRVLAVVKERGLPQ